MAAAAASPRFEDNGDGAEADANVHCNAATCVGRGSAGMLWCPGPRGDRSGCGAAIHVECGGWKRPLSRWVCRECRKDRGVLGCGKCRYSVGGCKDCNEEKKQAAAMKAENAQEAADLDGMDLLLAALGHPGGNAGKRSPAARRRGFGRRGGASGGRRRGAYEDDDDDDDESEDDPELDDDDAGRAPSPPFDPGSPLPEWENRRARGMRPRPVIEEADAAAPDRLERLASWLREIPLEIADEAPPPPEEPAASAGLSETPLPDPPSPAAAPPPAGDAEPGAAPTDASPLLPPIKQGKRVGNELRQLLDATGPASPVAACGVVVRGVVVRAAAARAAEAIRGNRPAMPPPSPPPPKPAAVKPSADGPGSDHKRKAPPSSPAIKHEVTDAAGGGSPGVKRSRAPETDAATPTVTSGPSVHPKLRLKGAWHADDAAGRGRSCDDGEDGGLAAMMMLMKAAPSPGRGGAMRSPHRGPPSPASKTAVAAAAAAAVVVGSGRVRATRDSDRGTAAEGPPPRRRGGPPESYGLKSPAHPCTCHQCQKKREVAVWCRSCYAPHCGHCMLRYPGLSVADAETACPRCRYTCQCKACLRMPREEAYHRPAATHAQSIAAARYLLSHAVPGVTSLLRDAAMEMYPPGVAPPAPPQSMDGTPMLSPPEAAALSRVPHVRLRGERMTCDLCLTSIAALHRSCSACGMDACLACSRVMRAGAAEARGDGGNDDDAGMALEAEADAFAVALVAAAAAAAAAEDAAAKAADAEAALAAAATAAAAEAAAAEVAAGAVVGVDDSEGPMAMPPQPPGGDASMSDAAVAMAVPEETVDPPPPDAPAPMEMDAAGGDDVGDGVGAARGDAPCAPPAAPAPCATAGDFPCPHPECRRGVMKLRSVTPGSQLAGLAEAIAQCIAQGHCCTPSDDTDARLPVPEVPAADMRVCATGRSRDPCGEDDTAIYAPTVASLDEGTFRALWQRGRPVVVRGVQGMMPWSPDLMMRCITEKGNETKVTHLGAPGEGGGPAKLAGMEEQRTVVALDCSDWMEVELKVSQFFKGYKTGVVDGLSRGALLKLKDWPPAEEFRRRVPRLHTDFIESLPLRAYTHPKAASGLLNIASKLPPPPAVVPPDLGPKNYIAYGRVPAVAGGETTHDSLTRLHCDLSDAVNVLLHVQHTTSPHAGGARPFGAGNSASEDDNGCPPPSPTPGLPTPPEPDAGPAAGLNGLNTPQPLGGDVPPGYGGAGAVWDIWRVEDVPKLRTFLQRKAEAERATGGAAAGVAAVGVATADPRPDPPRGGPSGRGAPRAGRAGSGPLGAPPPPPPPPPRPVGLPVEEDMARSSSWARRLGLMFQPKSEDVILGQGHFLTEADVAELASSEGVVAWRFAQHEHEAVFIPAGCPHQVRNLRGCIKVALDFVSPEHLGDCLDLCAVYRGVQAEDKLQLKLMMIHAAAAAAETLLGCGPLLATATDRD